MFKIIKSDKYSWANINEVNEENLARLKKLFKAHPLDLEDIKSEIHDPKLDVYKNYIFAVFNLPHYNKDAGRIERYDLDIFLGKDFLVTVHKDNLVEIDDLFKKNERNSNLRKDWLGKGADYLLYKILQSLFKTKMSEPMTALSAQLSKVENNIFEDYGKKNIRDLASVRRNTLLLRRMVEPQRFLMHSIANDRGTFVREEFVPYFDDIKDLLEKNWARLEGYKDTINGLYDTTESLLGHKTNEIIKTLTLISVSLMPLTLLASIYGMNIRLPLAEQPHYVLVMFVSIAVAAIIILAVLKKRKWL